MGADPGADHLERLVTAVTTLGAGLDLPVVLRHLIDAGVELVDATYGALGVLSPDRTHLSSFITVGIDESGIKEIGDYPKGHGILGLLIVEPEPLRLPDLTKHPESFGFPPNHPPMRSFLGVPVWVRGEVYGNLYLTDKRGAHEFTDLDEQLAVSLAAAAGVAIDNARLHSRSREVALLEDRERIARDLHDTVIQRLFATGLTLQGAARLAERPEVLDRIQQAVDELDVTVREVRSSIFALHGSPTTARGVRRRLLAVGDELADALGFVPEFVFDGPVDATLSDDVATHVVAVVREGLANVARHSSSPQAEVTVAVEDGELWVIVDDSGVGLHATAASTDHQGQGLGNLRARAEQLGGTMTVGDRAEGGTRLDWRVPC